jgi:hypothetical protein
METTKSASEGKFTASDVSHGKCLNCSTSCFSYTAFNWGGELIVESYPFGDIDDSDFHEQGLDVDDWDVLELLEDLSKKEKEVTRFLKHYMKSKFDFSKSELEREFEYFIDFLNFVKNTWA